MTFRRGTILALAAGLWLGGCAPATGGGGGSAGASPTGRVYEPGTRPTQTRFSQAATLAIAQGRFDQAMTSAREGIAAEPGNPQHHYLAGEAAVGLGNFVLADSMWIVAQTIYPAYELEIEPARESAWATGFNEGVEAFNAGNAAGAITAWRNADLIYKFRPEAVQNLAIVLTQEEEYEEAIELYQRGLKDLELKPNTRLIEAEEQAERDAAKVAMQKALAQLLLFTEEYAEAETILRAITVATPDDVEAQANLATALGELGREAEATQIYSRLLDRTDTPASQLFNIGVTLFTAAMAKTPPEGRQEYLRAAEAFGKVIETQPQSRDAWFNRANALYAAEDWAALIPIAERLITMDVLNETGFLILARAYRETSRNQDALALLTRLETVAVSLDEIEMVPGAQSTTVRGDVIGRAAAAGTPIRLRFTFYGATGALGTTDLTVNAPAREATQPFEVRFAQQADYYSYEVLP